MEIQIEDLHLCVLKVNYEANLDEILAKKTEVIKLFNKAPVPGFRKGKASKEAIEVHYKNQINESLKRALAEEAYYNTLFEKNIKPFGTPQENSAILSNNRLSYTFTLYKKPDFTLGQYKDLEVVKEPDDEREATNLFEKMIFELRQMTGEKKSFDENDFVQENDNVVLNFKGYMNSILQKNLSAEGQVLKMGSNFIPDFEQNIYGMKVGEKRTFSIIGSEKALPTYSGQKIDFDVELVSGQKTKPAELNDDMAKRINKENLDTLMREIKASANNQVNNARRSNTINNLTAKLLENTVIDVPQFLTLQEARYLSVSAGVEWDNLSDIDKNYYLTRAEQNVKLSLILEAIRENEADANFSDEEAFEVIKSNLKNMTDEQKNAELFKLAQNNQLNMMVNSIKDQFTLDYIYKNSKTVE